MPPQIARVLTQKAWKPVKYPSINPSDFNSPYLVLKEEEKKIIKKLNANYKQLYSKDKDCTDYYTNYLGLNTFMYSTDNQIDYTLQAILKADAVAKYSYKNGTRVKKGTFYKDANGIERFKPIADFSHIGEEPWPLKYSRFYSKELLKIDNSGHKKI